MSTILDEFIEISERLCKRRNLTYIILNRIATAPSLLITDLLSSYLYKRKIAKMNDRVVLNIGCGNEIIDGLVNLDLIPRLDKLFNKRMIGLFFKSKIIPFNLLGKNFFLEEKADGIICHHVLEHIPPNSLVYALEQMFKLLKPGGKLRISVPNYASYIQENIPKNQGFKSKTIALNSLFYGWGHLFMYDEELLREALNKSGFYNVSISEFKASNLGKFDSPSRAAETLYLVAIKDT